MEVQMGKTFEEQEQRAKDQADEKAAYMEERQARLAPTDEGEKPKSKPKAKPKAKKAEDKAEE
jgi:hypothetical protein